MIKDLTKQIINVFLRFFLLHTAEKGFTALPKGTVLVIAPHPDDETLCCGALIARLLANRVPVRVIIVSDGADATPPPGQTRENLAELRRTEALRATRALGLTEVDVVFLSHPDGAIEKHATSVTQDIASQIWLCSPTLIVSPYLRDAHADHRVLAEIVQELRLAGKFSCPVWEYPAWFWPRGAVSYLRYYRQRYKTIAIPTEAHLAAKLAALGCYASQTGGDAYIKEAGYLSPSFVNALVGPYEFFFESSPK